jgi:hypothetical protein
MRIARQQSAKSFELRAALSLGRLWQRHNKTKEARQTLLGISAIINTETIVIIAFIVTARPRTLALQIGGD